MKFNRAQRSIRAAYPINAEEPVEANTVAPSKRFPNSEVPARSNQYRRAERSERHQRRAPKLQGRLSD